MMSVIRIDEGIWEGWPYMTGDSKYLRLRNGELVSHFLFEKIV
jgi:hypothetical protein